MDNIFECKNWYRADKFLPADDKWKVVRFAEECGTVFFQMAHRQDNQWIFWDDSKYGDANILDTPEFEDQSLVKVTHWMDEF